MAGLWRRSYPPFPPRYPCLIPHPHPTGYPPRPNMNFQFFVLFYSFWLNYMKQKNFICMTTIDLLANQFVTNEFTSTNLYEITIHA